MVNQDAVTIRLLGPLEVVVGESTRHLGGPKQRALLSHLVLHAGEPISIAALVEAVWGDDAPAGTTRSLRTYASNLRKILGPAVAVRGGQATYTLDARSIHTDIDDFRSMVREATGLEDPHDRRAVLRTALDLWRGPFLADLDHPWVRDASATLDSERRRASAAWSEATIDAGCPGDAVDTLQHLVIADPFDEQACALLMRAFYVTGRQTDALATFRRLREALALEFGVEPGPDIQRLEEQILLHDVATNRGGGNALPAPSADLVGRIVEIEDLLARLEHGRFLSLTGPGGVGKTRLAIAVGRRVIERGDQPVFFADLSAVFDADGVDAVLAASIGVQPHPNAEIRTSLIEYLQPRRALLIVDNCEHLAASTARLTAALVRSCPQISVIATSRAPLHVDGEQEWRTPSLQIPDQSDAPIESLRQWPAVELLMRRAPNSFQITEANRRDVVELCRELDGLPLALELAAPRLGSMTPAEILASLGSTIKKRPASASGDARHETLDTTIGWSYDLLESLPKVLLSRLGVMSGGFLFDDVLAICALETDLPASVREWLSTLVDQSLVMAETSGTHTRYRLLETIRRFALDRLGDAEPETRRRHAVHFAELAEVEAARLLTRDEGEAVAELSYAHDNLRSAIGWAMATGEIAIASKIVASIPDWGYWRSRYELSRWAQWVWESTTTEDARWRAVCGSAARGAWLGGRFDDAVRFGSSGIDVPGPVPARSGHPDDVVADIALYRGDAELALAHYSSVAAAAIERGDTNREVWATYYIAVINTVLRRSSEAVDAATRALASARQIGNPTALAFSLYANGLAVKHRAPAEAAAMFEEAARMADSVRNDWFGGIARMELGSTKTAHGDLEGGLTDLAGVIDHWHRVGDETQLRLAWRYLARALGRVGLPDEAAILVGALADTPSALTRPPRRLVEELHEVLGEAEYGRLTVRGSIMSMPEVVSASLSAIDRAGELAEKPAASGR